ncbi:MAG: cytochrome b N-terminal domain-containing protein [Alphaproteobacteria bacterium]|nr:cytochrome b N-terminal domain-containing protein [Alphaproteobacteria bacterium]
MGSGYRQPFKNPVVEWIDSRMPVFTLMQKEYGVFPVPRNFNYFWNFGAIAGVMLVVMIATGIVLAMHYTAHVDYAFDSVERIMRDVNGGWLIRYLHMNGASFFFIAVYIHIFRGMYYGSYKKPRELLWILGVLIFLLMMATAFMGYVLPWGQMSYWGATVITNLFSAIPLVGDSIVSWLWGGFSVDNPTLNRFFALHYLMPFVIFAVVFLHVWALHVPGSNNPLGIEPQTEKDTLSFHPYYTVKDTFGLMVFLLIFAAFVFYAPDYLGHPDNYTPANPLVTPAHIVPEWYFLPFYAMLRAITFNIGIPGTEIVFITAKLGGVIAMFGSILLWFVLPWLDTHPVRSARFRPLYRLFFLILIAVFALLGYIGSQSADAHWGPVPLSLLGLACTGYYYAFFLGILPWLSRYEKAKALPSSIHEAVLKVKAPAAIVILAVLCLASPSARAAGDAVHPPAQHWSFNGPFGTFDRASLQRGLKVYREVCSACHSLDRVHYRNLEALGYDEAQVKAIAAEYTVTDGPNDEGEMFERPARPSDPFKAPFMNENAAKFANNGALPPDLSLIVKARHNGPDYVSGILTGYEPAPEGHELLPGQNWNKYMPGHVIAMAPPLLDGGVAYEDGSPETVEQYSHDVVNFLTWAADPYLEERKRLGISVLIFLAVFAGLMYAVKRRLWSDIH